MDQQLIETGQVKEVYAEALQLPGAAGSLVVEDQEGLKRANEFFLVTKALRKRIESTFEPIIKAAHTTWKQAIETKNRALAPVDDAEKILKKEIGLYLEAQEEIRQQRERELQAKARKEEEDRRLALAIEAEKAGHDKLADQVLAAPAAVPSVILPKAQEDLQGAAWVSRWEFEVTDLRLLAAAALDGAIPLEAIQANEKMIGATVRAMKGSFAWPGIQTREIREIRATGR